MQGPLLMYIGYKKQNTPQILFNTMLIFAIIIPFVIRFPKSKMNLNLKIINSLHYILIMPFFMYIGYFGKKLNPIYFKICFYLGLFVIFYHIYKLL